MYAGNRIGGSNPLASAIKIKKTFRSFFYFYLREGENRRFARTTKRDKRKFIFILRARRKGRVLLSKIYRTTKRVKDKKLAFFFLSEEERKDFMK